jgi:ribosomal protein L14
MGSIPILFNLIINMLNINSILKVKDNSGLKYIKVIKILGNSFRKNIKLGDILITSIFLKKKIKKKGKTIKKMFKSKINPVVLLTTKKTFFRKDNSKIRYDKTTVVFFGIKIRKIDVKDKRRKFKLKINVPVLNEFLYKGVERNLEEQKKLLLDNKTLVVREYKQGALQLVYYSKNKL